MLGRRPWMVGHMVAFRAGTIVTRVVLPPGVWASGGGAAGSPGIPSLVGVVS